MIFMPDIEQQLTECIIFIVLNVSTQTLNTFFIYMNKEIREKMIKYLKKSYISQVKI